MTQKTETSVPFIPLSAWVVMLSLGGLHTVDPRVPNLSYWVTLALVALVVLVTSSTLWFDRS